MTDKVQVTFFQKTKHFTQNIIDLSILFNSQTLKKMILVIKKPLLTFIRLYFTRHTFGNHVATDPSVLLL
jgi:hypothetical protein